jgi:GAF domain-containing protein
LSLGEVAATLGRVRSRSELNFAVTLVERLLNADDVTVSRVITGERYVETLTDHDGLATGERYSYDDYPTTEHVIKDQVVGQMVAGDPSSDPAELRLLGELGFAALLMVPVVARGSTVGLLEVSRRTGRPWTSAETEHARLVAQCLATAIALTDARGGELTWSADALGRGRSGALAAE